MRRIILSCVVLFAISETHAQVPSTSPYNGVVPAILNSSGGTYDFAGSYFRYEWSFGEMVLIQSFAPPDSSILVTHGVLQPCTDKIGGSPILLVFEEGDYKLFPNPTSGKFELDLFVRTSGQLTLQLIDATGRLLETRSSRYDGCCRIELFDLTNYPGGMYFVVADLRPDIRRARDNRVIIRHSGMKVVKIN